MNKREKKWFKGGGPFSEINKFTTDFKMISMSGEILFGVPSFDPGDLLDMEKAPWPDELDENHTK